MPRLQSRVADRSARFACSSRLQLASALLPIVLAGCVGELETDPRDETVVAADTLATIVAALPIGMFPLDEVARERTTGFDGELLAEVEARAAELSRLYGMIVARHGEIALERRFRGPALDAPTNVKSASKSIMSAIAGIAIAEGLLEGLDQPIAPFFAEHLGPEDDPQKRTITIRDLLSMRSGLETTSNRNYGTWVNSSNWVRYAIRQPVVAEPGAEMIYSTGNSHLLSAILTEATGQTTLAFARERLADPLGIRLPPWPTDPQGIYFGGNDMLISARDLLRFGELYRNGGVAEGREIIRREWIEDSWRVQVRRRRRGDDDYYGLGWWGRDTHGYALRFAWGYGGQFVFVVPALELTVVFTSDPWSPREGPHNSRLHAILDDLIVPAAIAGNTSAPAS